MPTPTAIEVSVDNVEYSRYESGRQTITATVTISGGAPYVDEEIRVDLVKARRSRDAVVATSTVDITSNVDNAMAEVTFYLPDVVDQDLIHLVRRGKYFVQATETTNEVVSGDSDDFDISIVTIERLKSDYLFGINLAATEKLKPKFQPSSLPVIITELSSGHPVGFHQLTYNYIDAPLTNATADIGSGANGTVTVTADTALAGQIGNDYSIEVVVPAGTESLSVGLSGTDITVTLDATAGVPNPAANTATLIAAAISGLANFSATASGTGADSIGAAEGPTAFTGGTSNVVRQLSWAGGPAVSITGTGTYVLRKGSPVGTPSCAGVGGTGRTYVCVKVTSFLGLPTAATVEEILIEKETLDDETLRRFVCEAADWVENDFLATFVEPTNVVTERDPTTIQFAAGVNAPTPLFTDTDFDFIWSPLTYYPTRQSGWVTIHTPFPQLLRVDSLYGAIANTRVIDIDLEWIEHSEQGGLIQLVPFNQEVAFDFIGLIWQNSIRGAAELPNFWHYNVIAGLRDTPYEIQELIAKKAAINALIVAGMALRPGVGSLSLSRDGVSESVSYTTSAEYGIYTGTIKAYQDWIDKWGPQLRAKYRGVTMAVV